MVPVGQKDRAKILVITHVLGTVDDHRCLLNKQQFIGEKKLRATHVRERPQHIEQSNGNDTRMIRTSPL